MPCSCWISSDVTIWAFRAPVILVLAVSGCCTPHTIHHTPYTIHLTPYAIHHTPYTTHHTPYTIHHTPYTIHHTPHTTHHTPHTIHHTPYTIHHTVHCMVCIVEAHYCDITQNIIKHSPKGNNLVYSLMLIPFAHTGRPTQSSLWLLLWSSWKRRRSERRISVSWCKMCRFNYIHVLDTPCIQDIHTQHLPKIYIHALHIHTHCMKNIIKEAYSG